MNRIRDFIEAHLRKINSENVVKVYSNENSATDRVRAAIERHNANVDKISFEGIEVDKDEVKMRIPDAFKRPVMYEAMATRNHYFSEGEFAGETKFSIQVIL